MANNKFEQILQNLQVKLKDCKIIVVDDVPYNIYAFKNILISMNNLIIDEAYNGQ